MTKSEQLVADILAEYADELDIAACERCKDCGKIAMCSFHSVLSMLGGHTLTPQEIERRRRFRVSEGRREWRTLHLNSGHALAICEPPSILYDRCSCGATYHGP